MIDKIADMDGGGVYFDEYQREILRLERELSVCEYSGLASVWAYQNNKMDMSQYRNDNITRTITNKGEVMS